MVKFSQTAKTYCVVKLGIFVLPARFYLNVLIVDMPISTRVTVSR